MPASRPRHPSPTDDRDASSAGSRWPVLVVGTLVAVPALLPLVVGFLPSLYFESDPRGGFDPAMIADLGPAGAAVWQLFCVTAGALAMGLHRLLGGRLHRPSVVLVALGVAAAWVQGLRHDENLTTTGAWIAGAVLGLAAFHAGQRPAARRWMAALVAAMMLPVGLQAGYDVLVQKPRDIAWFHAHEQEQLELKGIAPGSPQHLLLTRRAESMDATGPFGFSNALGTIAGAGALVAVGLALGCGVGGWRDGRRRWPAAAALCAAGLALVGVWFTHSTGAQGAIVLAVGLVAVACWLARTRMRRAVPWLALALVALPLVVVLLRATAGPPVSMAGERSLLFRYHYAQAAARMTADGGAESVMLGVGPAGFQQGYLVHKNPINPENVASAHSVFIDWVAMLGLGGWAWSAVALLWLWLAARRVAHDRPEEPPASDTQQATELKGSIDAPPRLLERPHVLAALVCAAAMFGTQYLVQQAKMDLELTLVWLAGVAGFVVVAAALGGPSVRVRGRWLRLGLLGAAAVVLVHSQIEMAFALMATAPVVWFLIGLAGSVGAEVEDRSDADRKGRAAIDAGVVNRNARAAGVTALVGIVLAVAFASTYTAPVVRHQRHLAQASAQLAVDQPYRALASLDRAHATLPDDEAATRWTAILRRDEMLTLLAIGDEAGARDALALALQPLESQVESGRASVGVDRLRVALLLTAAEAFHDEDLQRRAIDAYRRLPDRSPYNLNDAVTLGDLLDRSGDTEGAAEHYRRALEIDRQRYLDDATQLDDATRDRLQAWLDANATGESHGAAQR